MTESKDKSIAQKLAEGVDKLLDVKGSAEDQQKDPALPDVKTDTQPPDSKITNQPSKGSSALKKFQKFKRG